MGDKKITVVCFKWKPMGGMVKKLASGVGEYTPYHVNRLYRAVSDNLTIPHKFICITDDPTGIECKTIPLWDKCSHLGGCYNRLYVFSKDMKKIIGKRFVCIDLDCVILGNLDELFSRREDFVILKYFKGTGRIGRTKQQKYNGSLFMMNAGARGQVWDRFEHEKTMKKMGIIKSKKKYVGTDQAWINHVLGDGEALFDNSHGVCQYKRLSNPGVKPENMKIVFFASGKHDPSIMGHKWIKDYWNG